MLIPLLRLADNLDRSHDQRVQQVDCRLQNGQLLLQLGSYRNRDVDLEQWAAERTSDVFRQVYNRPVAVAKLKA